MMHYTMILHVRHQVLMLRLLAGLGRDAGPRERAQAAAALCTPDVTEVLLTYPVRFTESIFLEQAEEYNFEQIEWAEEVEPSLWCAECKRIAPQLRLTVDRQSLRWRHRIAEASRLAPAFATAALPAVPKRAA